MKRSRLRRIMHPVLPYLMVLAALTSHPVVAEEGPSPESVSESKPVDLKSLHEERARRRREREAARVLTPEEIAEQARLKRENEETQRAADWAECSEICSQALLQTNNYSDFLAASVLWIDAYEQVHGALPESVRDTYGESIATATMRGFLTLLQNEPPAAQSYELSSEDMVGLLSLELARLQLPSLEGAMGYFKALVSLKNFRARVSDDSRLEQVAASLRQLDELIKTPTDTPQQAMEAELVSELRQLMGDYTEALSTCLAKIDFRYAEESLLGREIADLAQRINARLGSDVEVTWTMDTEGDAELAQRLAGEEAF